MRKASVDIGVNWVCWLREEAAKRYIWDDKGQYHRVLHPVPSRYVRPAQRLRDALIILPQLKEKFPGLESNLFMRELAHMPVSVRSRISAFFTAHAMQDFQFLDCGGRAVAFRALHKPTGQMRVVRLEAPHGSRMKRPNHPVVLQPFVTNEGRTKAYGDIKLEIMPEVVPLSRLLWLPSADKVSVLNKLFYEAVCDIARGTNIMYDNNMFDQDAEPQNVGVLPDGRVISFDPEVVQGARAREEHRHFKVPFVLRDANVQQVALIYPVTPKFLPNI